MNNTPARRTILFGTSLATALVVAILVLTGGRRPAPAPISAPTGEAALPMLDGVNKPDEAKTNQTTQTPEATPAKAESKPASEAPSTTSPN
ncbi:MAG: hypothetical protein IPQ13_07015 [Holophagaceae bacterium]|nr:hypothetical protein [Holophagaceae bacterium]